MRTSTVGAATGAAMGAGLGAIIGSTSGDAGSGMVIGTAAGAATGLAVGYQLEKQEVQLRKQEEAIARQDAEIKYQNQQLRELRALNRDGGPTSFAPAESTVGSPLGSARSSAPRSASERYQITNYNRPSGERGLASRRFQTEQSVQAPAESRSSLPTAHTGQVPAVQGNAGQMQIAQPMQPAARRAAERAELRNEVRTRLSNAKEVSYTPPAQTTAALATREYESSSLDLPPVRRPPLLGPGAAAQHTAALAASEGEDLLQSPPVPQLPPAKQLARADTAPAFENAQPMNVLPKNAPSKTAAKVSAAPRSGAIGAPQTAPGALLPPAASTKKEDNADAEFPLDSPVDEDEGFVDLPAEEPPVPVFEEAKPVAKAKPAAPKDGVCADAEVEAQRARSSNSDGDRIFYLRRALRLCSQEPSYHVELGKVYASLGKKEDARFEFNKALELDPENEAAQDELSLMMLDGAK